MQTQYWKFFYLLANCIITLKNNLFPYCCLLIICIIFHGVQFSRYISESFKTHWNPLLETSINLKEVVGQSGLEPPTSRLSVVCSSQLSYWPIWWRLAGSNRWPPACKAGALPAELNPHISISQFLKWWAKMDSNHRPHDYQSCALASWAIGPYQLTSFGGD